MVTAAIVLKPVEETAVGVAGTLAGAGVAVPGTSPTTEELPAAVMVCRTT